MKEVYVFVDLRRFSLEIVKFKYVSVFRVRVNVEEFYDLDFEIEVISEEKVNYWKDVVEKWISRLNSLYIVVISVNKVLRIRLFVIESLFISFFELVYLGFSSSLKALMIFVE